MHSGFVVFVLIAGGGGGNYFKKKEEFLFYGSNRYTKHIFNLIRNRFFSTIIHRGNGCSNMRNKMNSNTNLLKRGYSNAYYIQNVVCRKLLTCLLSSFLRNKRSNCLSLTILIISCAVCCGETNCSLITVRYSLCQKSKRESICLMGNCIVLL